MSAAIRAHDALLRSALASLESATSFTSKKARDQNPTLIADIRAALAATPAAPRSAAPGWMPIETAPRDGQTLLLSVPTQSGKWSKTLPLAGKWWGHYWGIFNADEAIQRVNPTHWQPLPPPVTPSEGGKHEGSA